MRWRAGTSHRGVSQVRQPPPRAGRRRLRGAIRLAARPRAHPADRPGSIVHRRLGEAFEEALTAALAAPDLRRMLLGRWGDWLVMAADLTLLRSRLLVPADAAAAQDAQGEAERLRQRLLGRAEIDRAADWLES